MKRFLKVFTNLIAVFMLVFATFTRVGCGEDIKTAKVKIQLYDYAESEFYADSEVTLSIDLYGHLAPKTVEAIVKYINEGYYNNALIYQVEVGSKTQIMVGDLEVDGDSIVVNDDGSVNIVKKAKKPTLPGEFEKGGTKGSDLVNTKGSVGLWRDWYSTGDYTNSSATDSGSATWFMPTETVSAYNGYFCVFGQMDLSNSANSTALNTLAEIFESSTNSTEYVIYYTGAYDASKPDCGLTYHCVTTERFKELESELEELELSDPEQYELEKIFVADEQQRQFTSYNKYTIKVANNSKDGKLGAVIKSSSISAE